VIVDPAQGVGASAVSPSAQWPVEFVRAFRPVQVPQAPLRPD
jgi:hypothetical protein